MDNKKGRPRHTPTDELRKHVLIKSGQNVSKKRIAQPMGINVKTLEKYYAKELREGFAYVCEIVDNSLLKLCAAGNLGAICWFDKTRRGMRELTAAQADANKPAPPPPALGISWGNGGPGHGAPAGNYAIDVSGSYADSEHIETHGEPARIEQKAPGVIDTLRPTPFRERSTAEQWARLAEPAEVAQAREAADARALSPGAPVESEAEKDRRLRTVGRWMW